MQGLGGYLGIDEGRDFLTKFCGRADGFSVRGASTENRDADDVTGSKTGRKGILRCRGETKEVKKYYGCRG